MPVPAYLDAHKIAELVALEGRAKVTFPYDDVAHRKIERIEKDLLPASGSWVPSNYGTADEEYPGCILSSQTLLSQDDQYAKIYRVWEVLPGPQLPTSRIDPEDGAIIREVKQAILASTAVDPLATGPNNTRYEPRDGNSSFVYIKTTTTTDLSGVVTSYPIRVSLHLPDVLAGCAATYNATKGVGDDTSTSNAQSDVSEYSRDGAASARSSSSLSIVPELYLPLRQDPDDDVPGYVKQVHVYGAATEAALCAKLTSIYEVAVTGTLVPDLTVAPLTGNSSDQAGAIWFSNATYQLLWDGTTWKMGTPAGIQAGNYWSRTAAATGWLGAYTAHGAVTGTATVGVGRTVSMMETWNTQEVTLTTAGKHVDVSSNASAHESIRVSVGGSAGSVTLGHGFSVSTGGSQSRVRIAPSLHGQIIIANPTYSDTVNATAAATLTGLFTGVGTSSGFGADSHAQTVQSYVRVSAGPLTSTPAATVISSNSAPAAKTITSISIANPTVVTTSAPHGLLDGDFSSIAGSDSTPTLNGAHTITLLSPTTFSVAVHVTGAGTTGSVTGPSVVTTTTAHGLATGQAAVIAGSNSTPTIDGSRVVRYLSPTTFSVPVAVTGAGSAGSVQGPTVYNAIAIPPTEPPDIPRSGLRCLSQYHSSRVNATATQFLATVVDMAYFAKKPASLEYSDPTPTYRQGIAIIPNQPIFLGGAPTSYAISPAFSGGLAFDTTTGIISGTSSIGLAPTTYTITGTNASGSAVATVLISVSA